MENRPLPIKINLPEAQGFWEGVDQKEFRVQRCRGCGRANAVPKICCPYDGGKLDWVPAKGRGEVLTFSIVTAHAIPDFQEEAPYAIAIVMLEEGVPFYTRIHTDHLDEIHIGMPVEAVFVPVSVDQHLVYFQPTT